MKVKVAVVQESPIFFNLEKTIDKIEALCKECADKASELVVFPESFIPAYPRGFSFGATIGSRTKEGRKLYAEYYQNSLDLESEQLRRLEAIAKKFNQYLVIGVTEKQNINGSLYCSMLYISPSQGLLGVHRKIKPTGTERLIWAESNGEDLVTFQTKIGKIGGLICWENYMPLARMAMYKQGIELYIAPTADARDHWISTMKHIALEGRCFVLACNQYFTKDMLPERFLPLVKEEPVEMCRGGSVIISPLGETIQGPLFDQAGVLFAELDLEEVHKSKLDFDVIGHYARDDIFSLTIKGQPSIVKEKL